MPSRSLAVSLFLTFAVVFCRIAVAASPPVEDASYAKYFVKFDDDRSITERALNAISLTMDDVGRSFALLAGVSSYPAMSGTARQLRPARIDVEKLATYLVQQEFFDEVVVLLDNAVTEANLSYFLTKYFPRRMSNAPKSRFLFAYSGHGTTRPDGRGYLLTSRAANLDDIWNGISLRQVRAMLDEVVYHGHFVLALVNACYGADLHGRRGFGKDTAYWPKERGAHVITAGGTGELTWHDPKLGAGSIFFETLLAGLDGRADSSRDGLVSFKEIDTFLSEKIARFTDEKQNPYSSGLDLVGSKGGFFFLDQQRMVDRGLVNRFDPAKLLPFGRQQQAVYLPVQPAEKPTGPIEPAVGLYGDAALRPGDNFDDCEDAGWCPKMVVVPAGSFMMGSPLSEEGRDSDEGPQHLVTIAAPFAVGKYEVTFAEWDACVSAGGCGGYKPDDQGWDRGRRPVVLVSWEDALRYTSWLTRRTGKSYRLLSEAEWEYAARAGTTGRTYAGATIGRENEHYYYMDNRTWGPPDGRTCSPGQTAQSMPVGSFAPNQWGIHDMLGNVYEWVQDCPHDYDVFAPTDGSAASVEQKGVYCWGRVVRGSSFCHAASQLRSAQRGWHAYKNRVTVLGFRVARSLTP